MDRATRRAACLLLLVSVGVYAAALSGGFIFDDNVFLTENPLIRAGDGLARFWFSRAASDYWPVTSTSLWLEWRLWHLWAPGYHITNVLLHAGSVVLLWAVLRGLRMPGAFVGALLFAVHPLNAESVAWITERKNLLALVFSLAAVLPFARAPESGGPGRTGYALALVMFALAMLSKGSCVFIPLVLLGIAAWRRPLTRADGLRLSPFFAVAAAAAVWEAQFSTVGPAIEGPLSPATRAVRAGAALWFYLGKMAWPSRLSFDYGHWSPDPAQLRWWIPLAAAAAVTAALWAGRRRGTRPALFAWAYVCAGLAPALGLVSVGFMQYSPVSNHFTHLALPGAAAFAGWCLRRRAAIAAAACVPLAALTAYQAREYSDAERLYRATLASNPVSWLATNNLGVVLTEGGRLPEAEKTLTRAVSLEPDQPRGHNNLGIVYYRERRVYAALAEYRAAVRLDPEFAEAHNNLGATLATLGRLDEAKAEFAEALRLDPDNADAQRNFARARRLRP